MLIIIDKCYEHKKIIMKKSKTTIKTILASLLFITSFGYTNAQEKVEDKLIQGTWTFSDSPNTQWQFKDDGKCYDYLEGILLDTYSYKIVEEKSENGEVKERILTLVNTENPDESYMYNINKLNTGKLWLEHAVGFRGKYIAFSKEEETEEVLTQK